MKTIKVVVKKEFLDRSTGLIRKPGDTLTVTEKRLKEIKRSGDYVEVAKATEAKTAKKEN